MGTSPPRGSFVKQGDSNVGPGQYDDRNYDFGNKTKGFTIGEKRETRTVETIGPGTYEADRADGITKTKVTTTVNMSSSAARPASMAKTGGSNVAPGQYDDRSHEFGSNAKGFTIGEKRETRVESTVGPGSYEVA